MFQVEKDYRLVCLAEGSRPAPEITWSIGRKVVKSKVTCNTIYISCRVLRRRTQIYLYYYYPFFLQASSSLRDSVDTTKSIIKFKPKREDNGKTISCKAENPKMKASSIEDSILLSISCKYINRTQFYLKNFFVIYNYNLIKTCSVIM